MEKPFKEEKAVALTQRWFLFNCAYVRSLNQMLRRVAEEITTCHKQGYQIAVVVGGGNFFRSCVI